MIFGQDRNELRQMYADAWQRHQQGEPLDPLSAQIAAVIAEHPEYQQAIAGDLNEDFSVEGGQTNPFLHMGLHLGIREQVATDRPVGIRCVFQRLASHFGNPHEAEHRMIDCLAEILWESQRNQQPPDEAEYLERLKKL
ncbi:MAG: DUF1841 family protein [Pseudomonadota bacterium]